MAAHRLRQAALARTPRSIRHGIDALASNRDRHASLGLGEMKDGLATFVAHPAFDGLPAILETRGPDGTYVGELAQLRELRKKGRRRLAARRRRKPA